MKSAINLQERPLIAGTGRNRHLKGQECFLLPAHWSLHLYDYHARLRIGETPFDLHPGSLTLVPPNTSVDYHFKGPSLHYYAHFTLATPSATEPMFVPLFYDLRGDLHHFERSIVTMARTYFFNQNRVRAEAKLWDLLWELAAYEQDSAVYRHSSLEKALALIDARLGEPISVNSLAREVGLSRNHLTRLFRQHKGLTVVAYVRQQRAQRAKHLLAHTTMPTSSIAAQVNASNLQSFSALIKKETGHSPSYWRRHF